MRVARLSRPGRVVVAVLSAALIALGVSVPASAAQPAHPHTWRVAVGQEADHDAIQGMAFLPGTLWIDKGDTIVWTARAGEIHTVTFLATGQPLTPFNPGDPTQLFPQGGTSYDGVSYFNSGVLTDEVDSGFPAGTTYSLSFDTTGDFTYYCLVHGVMMKGVVHVRAAGTHYPFTQAQYNRLSAHRAGRDHPRRFQALARHRRGCHQPQGLRGCRRRHGDGDALDRPDRARACRLERHLREQRHGRAAHGHVRARSSPTSSSPTATRPTSPANH